MATAEQIKSLIKSHLSDDDERFYTVALQVAAHEAQQGHGALAHDLRLIIDKGKRTRLSNVINFPQDLSGMVFSEESDIPFSSLVMSKELRDRITRVIREYRQQNKLKDYGLSNRRKILLVGPPGTGKTMTAKVLAHELDFSLFTIQVDKLVTKFMGETSAKLRQIFDMIRDKPGVYLFDEFDAIGGDRTLDSDVGEMRRVLNALLQFIEQDTSESLIIGATNTPDILDRALFRRFDDVLTYKNPSDEERKQLMRNVLGTFVAKTFKWQEAVSESDGLSQAEIDNACRDAIKQMILNDLGKVTSALLTQTLNERLSTYNR